MTRVEINAAGSKQALILPFCASLQQRVCKHLLLKAVATVCSVPPSGVWDLASPCWDLSVS